MACKIKLKFNRINSFVKSSFIANSASKGGGGISLLSIFALLFWHERYLYCRMEMSIKFSVKQQINHFLVDHIYIDANQSNISKC